MKLTKKIKTISEKKDINITNEIKKFHNSVVSKLEKIEKEIDEFFKPGGIDYKANYIEREDYHLYDNYKMHMSSIEQIISDYDIHERLVKALKAYNELKKRGY